MTGRRVGDWLRLNDGTPVHLGLHAAIALREAHEQTDVFADRSNK